MRLTTAYYYPPSGRRIHHRNQSDDEEWGIDPSPECKIEMTDEELQAAVARLRERSYPVSNQAGASTQKEGAQGDPSIDADPQLKLAVEKLRELMAATTR